MRLRPWEEEVGGAGRGASPSGSSSPSSSADREVMSALTSLALSLRISSSTTEQHHS